jgi:hypothetical protein
LNDVSKNRQRIAQYSRSSLNIFNCYDGAAQIRGAIRSSWGVFGVVRANQLLRNSIAPITAAMRTHDLLRGDWAQHLTRN